MNRSLLNHFPGWYLDLVNHPESYYLVLSDDMDSFYSCRYLAKRTGVQIGGFYSFEKGLYLANDMIKTNKHPVYVDVAVCQDGIMAFDNHRSICRNHMQINPNIITDRFTNETYFQKYCGNTLMLIVALYGTVQELTELEKEFLCAIDSAYVGYYRSNGLFKDINIKWLEMLGLKECLLPIYESRDMQYFIDLVADWQLNEKIYIDDDGKLFTYADILPHDTFSLVMPIKKSYASKEELEQYSIGDNSLFIAAESYKGKYIINTIV